VFIKYSLTGVLKTSSSLAQGRYKTADYINLLQVDHIGSVGDFMFSLTTTDISGYSYLLRPARPCACVSSFHAIIKKERKKKKQC